MGGAGFSLILLFLCWWFNAVDKCYLMPLAAHTADLNTLYLHIVVLNIQLRRMANNNSKGINEREIQACVL